MDIRKAQEIRSLERKGLVILAGGPGSGRHKEFGSFKKTESTGKVDWHVGKHGTTVVENRHRGGKYTVHEIAPRGRAEYSTANKVHQTYDSKEHAGFLKDRYGIDAQTVSAGGPGSGRRPGGGSTSDHVRTTMIHHGFFSVPSPNGSDKGTSHFEHHSGARAMVGKDGSWAVGHGRGLDSGKGGDALHEKLAERGLWTKTMPNSLKLGRELESFGTSEGAKKAWDSRGRAAENAETYKQHKDAQAYHQSRGDALLGKNNSAAYAHFRAADAHHDAHRPTTYGPDPGFSRMAREASRDAHDSEGIRERLAATAGKRGA